MKDLIVPTPNLNGNSADNLVDKLREVLNATSILSMQNRRGQRLLARAQLPDPRPGRGLQDVNPGAGGVA